MFAFFSSSKHNSTCVLARVSINHNIVAAAAAAVLLLHGYTSRPTKAAQREKKRYEKVDI